jgi:hypothetical protein
VLVLSGATTAADLAGAEVQPDYVIDGIGQLLPAGLAAATASPSHGSTR